MPFWKRKSITPNAVPSSSQHQWQATIPARGGQQVPPLPAPAPAMNPFYQRGNEFFNKEDYKNAIFMYREALRQPMDVAMQTSSYQQMAIAQTMVNPPELVDALNSINMAVQLNPSSGHIWRIKADIHEWQGDYGSAKDALANASALLTGYEKIQVSQALSRIQSRNTSGFMGANPPNIQRAHPTHTTPPVITTPTPAQGSAQPGPPSINISQAGQQHPSTSSPRPGASPPPFISAGQTPAAGSSLNVPASPPRAPTPNSAFGASLAQQLNIPTEAPPAYSSNTATLIGSNANLFNDVQFEFWRDNYDRSLTGGMYLKPVTAEGSIDIICCLFWGKTYIESIQMDISPAVELHSSWKPYHVSSISNPGNTFLDYDSETSASYDGYHAGTVSVLGYVEEYREFQLAMETQLSLYLLAKNGPPLMDVDKILDRLVKLQLDHNLEDNVGLSQILGVTLGQNLGLAPGTGDAATQTAIEDICLILNKGFANLPDRFESPLTTTSLTSHVFTTQGIGLRNFLFMILLGAELVLRMDKLGSGRKYPSFMTIHISSLAVIARQWMENVKMSKNPTTGSIVMNAMRSSTQEQALISFAETIGWPYMDEARQNINGLYSKLGASPSEVHNYLVDWLYGLVLPGKFFRHHIMTCLVLACPTTKHLGIAPFYQNALVVGDKSYWPKRTAMGRILAGEFGIRTTCGWVGPVKAPSGVSSSWVLVCHKDVDFVTPVVDNLLESNLQIFGFSDSDIQNDPQRVAADIVDMTKWRPPTGLPRRADADEASVRKAAQLDGITLDRIPGEDAKYRAHLKFTSHEQKVTFTLYNNPVFVHVPKCQGSTHPIHERKVNQILSNVVLVKDLKSSILLPTKNTLMIIDATQQGEEAVAKAWCAETGRHAVVRKDGVGCFTCATNMATARTGLGFNVLIWVS